MTSIMMIIIFLNNKNVKEMKADSELTRMMR
jgi:hypothetical protein